MAANLWQHTCFELFVAERGMPGYHEFNFAPSGEWAVYAFAGYRRSVALGDTLQGPQIHIRQAEGRLELDAIVHLDSLIPAGAVLAAGVTAVIEDRSGGLSYWAVTHAGDKPDFHRAESFTLEIDAVRN